MTTRHEIKNYERFIILAQYFINSYNPKPDNMPQILDMILSIPDSIVPLLPCGRYFAHDFCRGAVACLSGDDPSKYMVNYPKVVEWMKEWKTANT